LKDCDQIGTGEISDDCACRAANLCKPPGVGTWTRGCTAWSIVIALTKAATRIAAAPETSRSDRMSNALTDLPPRLLFLPLRPAALCSLPPHGGLDHANGRRMLGPTLPLVAVMAFAARPGIGAD
jgi:hypothetical protein